MKHVRAALMAHRDKIMRLPNVVGVGRGLKRVGGKRTTTPSLVIMVSKKVPETELDSIHIVPRSLDGAVTDVVEVGEIRALRAGDPGLGGRITKRRPAQPGVSIGHYKVTAGTFGALVKDGRTGEPLILSNNHVLANATDGNDGRAQVGDAILQPGAHDGGILPGDTIATLERFIPVRQPSGPSDCPIARGTESAINLILRAVVPRYRVKFLRSFAGMNVVDCAVAKPVSRDLVIPEILGIGDVAGTAEAEIGMVVQKSGRTTGVNTAEVMALDAVVRVDFNDRAFALFEDQIVTGVLAKGGDSGSLVLTKDKKAVGLLFAGSDETSVCNRIQNVLDLLNVTF